MTSNNYLNVKTRLSEFKSNTDKDAASEASSGTTNSLTSAEELQNFAVILGLSSAEDVHQERFRVDRRRLEAMMADDLEESQKAHVFFQRIMNETNTVVNWPLRLKIGARSKKDPHVRVAGRPDDVIYARTRILSLLEIRSNRVTMKIDVSYTDHSHIIGKGGLTIKRVMEETGCHIHFPDSNRNPGLDKSNQVSIAGDMERVERARARVRALTPLVFSFELPLVQPPDINSAFVKQVQDKYKVQVTLRTRQKLHATLMVVKGVQWEVECAMEATTQLMNYMCGSYANQTKVQMSLEISPMHHSVVKGRNAEQLKMIMRGTKTQIMVPEADDPNISNIKKSCVTITGGIHDVYAARQQLIGSLPLVIMFEVPEGAWSPAPDVVASLQARHGVLVTARRRPKNELYSVQLKGLERCAGKIYEARREILGANGGQPVSAALPESYAIPDLSPLALPDLGAFQSFSPPQLSAPLVSVFAGYAGPPTPGGFPAPPSPAPPLWPYPSPQPRAAPFIYPNIINPNAMVFNQDQNGTWTAAPAPSMRMPDVVVQSPHPQHPQHPARQSTMSILNSSSQASSGYQSNFTGSLVSLDTHSISGCESNSNMVSPSSSPVSNAQSPASCNDVERSQHEIAHIISDIPLSERRAVGCEKKTLETIKTGSPNNYHKMKAEAEKAMQEPLSGAARVPTPRWAGSFFSRTSPGAFNLPEPSPEKTWSSPVRSGSSASSSPQRSPDRPQLCDVLGQRALHKYIDLFKQHEVDFATFVTLNEHDLIEIGVTAFGARRKMLILIDDIKQQKIAFKVSAAPGAERKQSPQYNVSPGNW